MEKTAKKWLWLWLLGGLSTLILCLCLVWVNIELVNLSYDIKSLQQKLDSEKALRSKLQVEKMNLTSNYRLREFAARFDLEPPSSDQIRKLK
jgi:cell division protein FtsL